MTTKVLQNLNFTNGKLFYNYGDDYTFVVTVPVSVDNALRLELFLSLFIDFTEESSF